MLSHGVRVLIDDPNTRVLSPHRSCPLQAERSAAAAQAAAVAAAAPHVGEYQCESCTSDNTSFDIIGGAAVGTRKAETFGKKDAPELILRVVCHACGNNWLEER